MNVVFLDYDGVVNTPQWKRTGGYWKCGYGMPYDGAVNDFQAVQWVSEFCEKFGYSIVVSSTWRDDECYANYLMNGGLREGIKVIGRTPFLDGQGRGDEIALYLEQHPEITGYLIFDDDENMGKLGDRLVKCNPYAGFGLEEFQYAETLHMAFNGKSSKEERTRVEAFQKKGSTSYLL